MHLVRCVFQLCICVNYTANETARQTNFCDRDDAELRENHPSLQCWLSVFLICLYFMQSAVKCWSGALASSLLSERFDLHNPIKLKPSQGSKQHCSGGPPCPSVPHQRVSCFTSLLYFTILVFLPYDILYESSHTGKQTANQNRSRMLN